MKFKDNYKSPNYNIRRKGAFLNSIILHYTAIKSYREALIFLCNRKNKVSSHFFIKKSGEIYCLVDPRFRAWHAGHSCWKGKRDINSQSIGIEIDNSGHHNRFEKYTNNQIDSLSKLLKYICKKYNIDKKNIFGHSDIAPYRKIDPGEKFPWITLERQGLSFLPQKEIKFRRNLIVKDSYKNLSFEQRKKKTLALLKVIGYDVNPAFKKEKNFTLLIKAYQMHYMQKQVSGKLDFETYSKILNHHNQLLT